MISRVLALLGQRAKALEERLRLCPTVDTNLGDAIRRRLASSDWIKSPELYTFATPISRPTYWKTTEWEDSHVAKRFGEFPVGSTTLDLFENSLAIDLRNVKGFVRWFNELGGASGSHFDLRLHALSGEMLAIAQLDEIGTVEKLPAKAGAPDYRVDLPGSVAALEAKSVFKRAWAVGVMQTALKALVEFEALPEAQDVMLVVTNPEQKTVVLDDWVAGTSTDRLASAIYQFLESGNGEFGEFTILRRTDVARSLGLYATFVPVASLEDWQTDREFRTPGLPEFSAAALRSWEQCEKYEIRSRKPRLNLAWVLAEATLGHPEISTIQAELRYWMETEIWPRHPYRGLGTNFPDVFANTWLVNPLLFPRPQQKVASNAP